MLLIEVSDVANGPTTPGRPLTRTNIYPAQNVNSDAVKKHCVGGPKFL